MFYWYYRIGRRAPRDVTAPRNMAHCCYVSKSGHRVMCQKDVLHRALHSTLHCALQHLSSESRKETVCGGAVKTCDGVEEQTKP
jgi:hypothetical protein